MGTQTHCLMRCRRLTLQCRIYCASPVTTCDGYGNSPTYHSPQSPTNQVTTWQRLPLHSCMTMGCLVLHHSVVPHIWPQTPAASHMHTAYGMLHHHAHGSKGLLTPNASGRERGQQTVPVFTKRGSRKHWCNMPSQPNMATISTQEGGERCISSCTLVTSCRNTHHTSQHAAAGSWRCPPMTKCCYDGGVPGMLPQAAAEPCLARKSPGSLQR